MLRAQQHRAMAICAESAPGFATQSPAGPSRCAAASLRHVSTSTQPPPSPAAPASHSNAPQRRQSQSASNGFLSRLLTPTAADGKSSFLSALGFYSDESRAIGAARTLYEQAAVQAATMTLADANADGAPFAARFEMLSLHVYVVLRRLRQEKGAAHEANVSKAMQTLFDVFWTDVRNRMLIKEEGLRLVSSAKWIKECEQRFFGMALAIDDCLEIGNAGAMRESLGGVLARNITCLEQDDKKIGELVDYLSTQLARHGKQPFERIWEDGLSWTL